MKRYHHLHVVLSLVIVLSMLIYLVPSTVSATAVTIIASESSMTTPDDTANLYVGYYNEEIENAAIKFDLSTAPETPNSVLLQIYVNIDGCIGDEGAFDLYGGSDDSWTSPNMPSNMTSGTFPIRSNVNKSELVNGWNTIDVTSFVQEDLESDTSGIVSFYLMGIASTENNDILVYSAFNASTAPRLILSYANDESRLASIKIGGVSLPGFDPDVYTYSYPTTFGADLSSLVFSSTTYDSGATQSDWTYDSASKKWSVTVTARDGVTKKTYDVTVSADTAIATDSSKTTSGDAGYLYVGYYGGVIENAAVKFDLSAGSETPSSAVLQIYVSKSAPFSVGTAGAFDLYGGLDDDWISPDLPANMSTGITPIRDNINYDELVDGWNSFDVTSFVQSQLATDSSKIVSLYLMGIASTEDNDICIDSALNASTAPRLVLTYGTNEARLSNINIGGSSLSGFASDTYEYSYTAIIGTNLADLVFSSTTYDTNATQSEWTYDAVNRVWSVTVTAKDGTTQRTYNVNVSISDTVAAVSSSKTTSGDEGYLYVGYYKGDAYPSGIDENAAVKFDLSGCTEMPTKVTLKLYVNKALCEGEEGSFDVYGSSDDSWIPPALPLSSSLEATAIKSNITYNDLVTGWNDIDVTNFVQSQFSSDSTKMITLYLKGATHTVSNDIAIYSASSGLSAPSLNLSFASSEARLSGITVGGTTLTGFSADTYSYNYVAPHDTDLSTLDFGSTVIDSTASQGAWVYDSVNHMWSVTITAQDTTTVITYSVSVSAALESSDASLTSISIDGTPLTGFSSSTLNYNYIVAHDTDASVFTITSDAQDHMAVQGGWDYDSVNKQWSNIVTSEDETTQLTYTVTIDELPDTDATLSSIRVAGTEISGLSSSAVDYSVDVVHGTVITAASFVSVTSDVNAEQGVWTYNAGTGKWNVLVTAEDGTTQLTYTVTINELPDTDATLSSIKVDGTDLSGFSPSSFAYTYDVVHGVDGSTLSLTSEPTDDNASQGDWSYDASTFTWSILVTAEDGITQETYTVTINELPDTDATLSSIRVAGTEIPGFSSSVIDYTVDVVHGTAISAASFVSATSDVNAEQGTWTYNAGTGKWSVLVTAEDGDTQKTYSVTINELPDTDATLKSIKVNGTTIVGFSPATLNYTVDVVHGTVLTSASFVSATTDVNAAQGNWTYNAVTGKWSVLVTAEDSVTKRTYTVTINELPNTDATLKSIKIDGTNISGFSPLTLNYTYIAPKGSDLAALVFTSACSDTNATQSAWAYDALNHKWSVTVTAQDTSFKKTYSVTVTEDQGRGDYKTNTLRYQSHVQDVGWMDTVMNGNISGTTGQSKRMEAIRIKLQDIAGGIEYCTHIQDIGWVDWSADDSMSGTTAQSKRLEAIKIRLTGEAADNYDIYYRVHVQDIGWMGWAKNGESAGTAACSYRMESIQIVMVLKGDSAPGSTDKAFYNGHTNQYNEQ